MLPFILTYVFQATQYARAPVKYNYFVVYAKNADISIRNGTDLAPDGEPLLRNSTTQEGLYNLTLGRWAPGYLVNYTDAFCVVNREAFNISLISLNFSGQASGSEYLRLWIQNDTDGNGSGDTWILVWDGIAGIYNKTRTFLNVTNSIFLLKEGGTAEVWIEVDLIDDPKNATENIGYGDGENVDFYTTYKPILRGSETVYVDEAETSNYSVYRSEGLVRFVYPVEVTNESLGVGDGAQTRFYLNHKPVVENSETVYLDNTVTHNYTTNYDEGYIDFPSPPTSGTTIGCDYRYWVSDPPGSNDVYDFHVGTGNGTRIDFFIGHSHIVGGTDTVYLDGAPTTDYALDYITGELTFNTPPGNNTDITADYSYWVPVDVDYQYPRYGLSDEAQSITYEGTIYLWFTSRAS